MKPRKPLPKATKPLKRTPLVRYQRVGDTGVPYPLKRTPVKAKRATPRRTSVLRDRGYLDWLKTQPCVVTRLHGFPVAIVNKPHLHWKTAIVDPAHGPPAGMRIKGPDEGAISLTRWYHDEQTRVGWPAFEERYGFSREAEAAILYARYLAQK